jgi:Na+/melibiose symporter-like transporter
MLFWEAETMGQRILISAFCLLVCGCGLAVSAWLIATGQIERQGIDALFLLAVALLMAFSFALIPLQEIRRGLLDEIGESLKARRAASRRAGAAAPAENAENSEAKQPTLPGAR